MDKYLTISALGLYLLAFFGYVFSRKKPDVIFGRYLLLAGCLANFAAVAARAAVAAHWPGISLYEFGLLFNGLLAGILFVIDWRCRMPAVMPVALALLLVMTAVTAASFSLPRQLMPALKSWWLAVHISVAVLAYGLLAASFCTAVLYLWQTKITASNPDDTSKAAWLTDRLIVLAMPFLTLVIVTGAVWAEYAWGSYWRWDPKETWSLITWLIYSAYFHFRLERGYDNPFVMSVASIGFIAVIFTYLGVSFLLPGLHSYLG
ncbi:cytochrome c biogenesis protein CcsA [Anaeroselena agilis]|uniref:Cytochrome c biogenesis protein CcsA n=1 Tax=Anaeroselena agilis TaxID=3063788 RepID=A0ABU3P009_9FIRM|nr:cytochrome c biogenesis protein CcsA [Selenomonadales bacterium 4137-cl]